MEDQYRRYLIFLVKKRTIFIFCSDLGCINYLNELRAYINDDQYQLQPKRSVTLEYNVTFKNAICGLLISAIKRAMVILKSLLSHRNKTQQKSHFGHYD